MADAKQTPERFVVEFERSPDYKDCVVTGGQGSFTLAGDLFVQFFVDKNSDPTKIDLAFDSIKTTQDIPSSGIPSHPIRVLEVGLVINRMQAALIGKWLMDMSQIDMEAMTKVIPHE
ncbi:MAG: hypothetical protein ACYC96_16010 [Fimbriimonadaceae bacterium]